jgi:tetratricopeptide (TPR) repeat protein
VLDDLRDPADLGGPWPGGPAGTVLITAREQQTVAGAPPVRVVPVGAFSPREAMKYLMGRLSTDTDQRHGAIGLVGELDGDPSVLAQASAVIASTMLTCQDYQQHFTQRRNQLTGPGGHRQPAAAAVTWTISAEQAGRLAPGGAAQFLLAHAALLDGHAIPGLVFTAPATVEHLAHGDGSAVDAHRAWEAVQALEHTGLLAIDPATTPPTIRISRALQEFVRPAMPEPMLDRAAQAAADALLQIWPEHETQPWQATSLRSCVTALRHTAGDRLWEAGACHRLLLRAGQSLDDARLTGPAADYWAQLTLTSDKILGSDHPATLTTGSRLARALLAAGQAGEAVAWSRWVADGRTRTLGCDHRATLATQVSLGHALTAAGQPDHAVTVMAQALDGYDRTLGTAHPDTLRAQEELAAACQAASRPAEAIEHYQRALADREHLHGPRHPATITVREHLAGARLADGRHKEAIAAYKQALADREHAHGADYLDTIAARRNLAAAYQAVGKIAAALQLHEQVCTGYERALGEDHPQTLACRAGLASAYHTAGRLTDAATLLRDILARCEQALPPGDPLTRTVRQTLTEIASE